MPTLFVAKAGGHLTELAEIATRLPSDGDDIAIWATNDNAQSRSVLSDKSHVFVPYVDAKDVVGVAKMIPLARRLHREHKFTRVISTGSGTALPFLPYLSLRGVPAHFIETATRVDKPSLTGRVLSAVPGIRLYTQYEQLAHGRWHRAGWVFDRFKATRAAAAPIRRAVVASGSSNSGYPFRRMLEALAALLGPGGALERAQERPIETLWQTGGTPTDGLGIEPREWVPTEELEAAIAQADVVISHAGTGSAFSTMAAGRFPVLVPRDPDRGEIGDTHQRLFAAELDKHGIAMCRDPEALTADDLLEAATYRIESVSDPSPIRLLP
jgi:UDP-N-acetylglucosamine--N-acetylmuramyl-(pentapeptide) pyrophosphoryl-undecaprenol N-acetylglucosamine transferase